VPLEPNLIIFCGVAGGLKPDQQIGDLVLASKIIDADLRQLPAIVRDTPYKNALIDPHTLTSITGEYELQSTEKNK
jgi:nucleoside phosphorylase